MAISCVTQVGLEFVGGGSDKLYVIQVQADDASGKPEYIAVGYYGRRGGSLSTTQKYKGSSLSAAETAARKLEADKRGKGYTNYSGSATIPGLPASAPVFGGVAIAGTTTVKPTRVVTGPTVMLAEVADKTKAAILLASSTWATQKKYDGERVPVSLTRARIEAYNRKGQVRPLTANAELEMKSILALPDFSDERETIVDGELMGDEYIVYDLLVLRDNDVSKLPFVERFSLLEELFDSKLHLLAETAWSDEEKSAMYAKAGDEEWEGVMFREVDSKYTPGRTASLLKHKLWETTICRVLTANAARSVQLAMQDETGKEIFIGNVTIAINQDIPEPDDLVEVRYLYRGAGGSLYQPNFMRLRTDIDEADAVSSLRQAPPEKRAK